MSIKNNTKNPSHTGVGKFLLLNGVLPACFVGGASAAFAYVAQKALETEPMVETALENARNTGFFGALLGLAVGAQFGQASSSFKRNVLLITAAIISLTSLENAIFGKTVKQAEAEKKEAAFIQRNTTTITDDDKCRAMGSLYVLDNNRLIKCPAAPRRK